jgi:hypothetical protein
MSAARIAAILRFIDEAAPERSRGQNAAIRAEVQPAFALRASASANRGPQVSETKL